MRRIRSLAYRTDLIFPAYDGEVLERGDHLVVKTPKNPGYYWGNYLLFFDPPEPGDFTRWRGLFEDEIGRPPEIKHQVFGWDDPSGSEGAAGLFLEAGFRLVRNEVLAAESLRRPRPPVGDMELRPLGTGADWEQAVENQVACREPEFAEAEYREFRQRDMERYRSMSESGLGQWYGAFVEGQLVADLGIFYSGTVGRYQVVETHPNYRRRGIGGALLFEAGRLSIEDRNLDKLLIVAEEGAAAARLYGTLGFRKVETQLGLEKWPQ